MLTDGRESDEMEQWLEREFETPAEEPIRRAIAGQRLSVSDWHALIRFFAAQDARTPARFEETFRRNEEQLPHMIESTLQRFIAAGEVAVAQGKPLPAPDPLSDEERRFPLRVTVVPEEGGGGRIVGEALNGRAMWLWSIRRALTHPISHLLAHRWTILRPPSGKEFLTSDNPVIRLRYTSDGDYDLKGGWGVPRTNLMLPLSPSTMLFTEIGSALPSRNSRMPQKMYDLVCKVTIENAYRYVIGTGPDDRVATLRPRLIDEAQLRLEKARWAEWHAEHMAAELEIHTPASNGLPSS